MSGFGGVLPWARRTIVEEEHWLTSEEFSAMLGICQIVPGPNIVNLGVCVGSRFAGIPGAIAAVMGLLLGPVALVIVLGILYGHYSYMPLVQGMLRGVSAVGVGLIASTGARAGGRGWGWHGAATRRPKGYIFTVASVAASRC